MPDITLPTPGPGGTPGPQYAEMINTAIDSVNDVIETGRLSETELSDTIGAVGDSRYQRTVVLDAKGPSRQTDTLRAFRMALAKREIAPCTIHFTGHSLIEGQISTARPKRGTDRFRDIMRARFPTAGAAGGYGYLGTATGVTSWSSDNFVSVAGGSNSSQYGLNGNARFVNAAGAYVRLESIVCTAVDVLYVRGGGGSFTTKVDGVANSDTVSTSGGPTGIVAYRVPGISGPAAAHTVDAGFVSGNSIIAGFIVYNGDETKGIRVHNGGWSGVTSAGMLDPNNVRRADVGAIAPSLIVVSMLANDFKTATALATSKANVNTFLDQLRAKAPGASIVLNIEHQLGKVAVPPSLPWADYAQVYYDIAEERGDVAVWDFWQRIGVGGPPPAAHAAGLIDASDEQHYTDAGYLMWAEALAAFVSP